MKVSKGQPEAVNKGADIIMATITRTKRQTMIQCENTAQKHKD